MSALWHRFWAWYQRNYLATLVITTAVFLLQLFHLYWLFTDVVLRKLTGHSYFVFPGSGMVVYVLADYLEIPALVSATLLYVYQFRRRPHWRSMLYIVLLNTQWIHMLWITDQVVVDTFTNRTLLAWNGLVAWVAILIDYLEVPVIVDTLRQVWHQRTVVWRRITRQAPPTDPGGSRTRSLPDGTVSPVQPGTMAGRAGGKSAGGSPAASPAALRGASREPVRQQRVA